MAPSKIKPRRCTIIDLLCVYTTFFPLLSFLCKFYLPPSSLSCSLPLIFLFFFFLSPFSFSLFFPSLSSSSFSSSPSSPASSFLILALVVAISPFDIHLFFFFLQTHTVPMIIITIMYQELVVGLPFEYKRCPIAPSSKRINICPSQNLQEHSKISKRNFA